MFTTSADEREFCFVSYYECDLIRQAVGALFVSVSSDTTAEQATAVKQKQRCNHVAALSVWFCFGLIHFVLLGPVQSDHVLLQSTLSLCWHSCYLISQVQLKSALYLEPKVSKDFTLCTEYDNLYL